MKKSGSFLALFVMIVLGLVLIAYPESAISMIIRILGIGLIVFAIGNIASQLLTKDFKLSGMTGLVGDIAALVIGLFCFISPSAVEGIFHLVLGGIIIYHGVVNLLRSLDLKALNGKWQVPLALSLLAVLVGVLVILNIIGPLRLLVRIAGVVLIYNGALGIWLNIKRG